MFSSNVAFEELVLRSLKASPLIKPFLTPVGWQEVKCGYWKVSVGLKCVRTSRMDSVRNRFRYSVVTLLSLEGRKNLRRKVGRKSVVNSNGKSKYRE